MNWYTWALLSALFAGATAVLAKHGVAGINSHLATAIRTLVIVAFSWCIVFWYVPRHELSTIDRRTWIFLILSGIATGLSWLCYFRALQLGDVSRVAAIDKLGLVFAILLAVVFLRERLTWLQWGGVILIVLGTVAVSWKSGR